MPWRGLPCGLGHAHPVIAEAIAEQAATLIHTSNLFEIPANRCCPEIGWSFWNGRDLFLNSGAESNEGAIKIARKFGSQQGIVNPKILVAEQSFHGRTLATLSATGNKRFRRVLRRWFRASSVCHLGMWEAIQEAAIHHPDIVAILIEPIQGEGGVNTAPQGFSYLEEVRVFVTSITGWWCWMKSRLEMAYR